MTAIVLIFVTLSLIQGVPFFPSDHRTIKLDLELYGKSEVYFSSDDETGFTLANMYEKLIEQLHSIPKQANSTSDGIDR